MDFNIKCCFLYIKIGSSGLPLNTQAPSIVPGSTATTTIAPAATTHSSLPTQQPLVAPPINYHVTTAPPHHVSTAAPPPLTNSTEANLNAAVLPSNVVPPAQPAKVLFFFINLGVLFGVLLIFV